MNIHDFLNLYWKNYISIEKEFVQTLNYVSMDIENYNTFSSAYIKILLQIGSEIDVIAKSFCESHNKSLEFKNINDYRSEIMKRESDFSNVKVKILQSKDALFIRPWEAWGVIDGDGKTKNPNWWTVYNKVKHNRNEIGDIDGVKKEYYRFANLNYILHSLAGLFQLLIYYYYDLAQKERIKVPLPGSRMFALVGYKWDDIVFYQDMAFYIDTSSGHLKWAVGEFIY